MRGYSLLLAKLVVVPFHPGTRTGKNNSEKQKIEVAEHLFTEEEDKHSSC